MSTPEPVDDSYPDSWKPIWIKEREAQRTEFETRVANLSDEALKRIRRGDR